MPVPSRRTVLIVFLFVVGACTPSTTETTSPAATAFTVAPTTTAPTTTTTIRSTTTTERVYDFEYGAYVYDAFETSGAIEVDAPCVAVSNMNTLREGALVVLRDEATDAVLATTEIGPGMVAYDSTGPEIGDANDELFYFCAFPISFTGVPLKSAGGYVFEFPDGTVTGLIIANDLLEGRVTVFSNDVSESQRQTIRLGA